MCEIIENGQNLNLFRQLAVAVRLEAKYQLDHRCTWALELNREAWFLVFVLPSAEFRLPRVGGSR